MYSLCYPLRRLANMSCCINDFTTLMPVKPTLCYAACSVRRWVSSFLDRLLSDWDSVASPPIEHISDGGALHKLLLWCSRQITGAGYGTDFYPPSWNKSVSLLLDTVLALYKCTSAIARTYFRTVAGPTLKPSTRVVALSTCKLNYGTRALGYSPVCFDLANLPGFDRIKSISVRRGLIIPFAKPCPPDWRPCMYPRFQHL